MRYFKNLNTQDLQSLESNIITDALIVPNDALVRYRGGLLVNVELVLPETHQPIYELVSTSLCIVVECENAAAKVLWFKNPRTRTIRTVLTRNIFKANQTLTTRKNWIGLLKKHSKLYGTSILYQLYKLREKSLM